MAIEIQGETYDFRFTPARVEKIEREMGKSLMSMLYQERLMPSLSDLRIIFINSLKKEEGGYIQPKLGNDAFDRVIETEGYTPLIATIVEALDRDCPFFFREA